MGAFLPKRPPQPTLALGAALALAHLAEPAGEPYLLHGHVIRENFIVKKELHLAGRGGHSFRNSLLPQIKNLVHSRLSLPL